MKNIDFSNIELSFSERITLHLLPIIKSNRFFRYQTLDYLNRLGLLDRDHGVLEKIPVEKLFYARCFHLLVFVDEQIIALTFLFVNMFYQIFSIFLVDQQA